MRLRQKIQRRGGEADFVFQRALAVRWDVLLNKTREGGVFVEDGGGLVCGAGLGDLEVAGGVWFVGVVGQAGDSGVKGPRWGLKNRGNGGGGGSCEEEVAEIGVLEDDGGGYRWWRVVFWMDAERLLDQCW